MWTGDRWSIPLMCAQTRFLGSAWYQFYLAIASLRSMAARSEAHTCIRSHTHHTQHVTRFTHKDSGHRTRSHAVTETALRLSLHKHMWRRLHLHAVGGNVILPPCSLSLQQARSKLRCERRWSAKLQEE